eukprot:TRINITY_DN42043_c0_g1_i2.p1 TRINITY_DN42043_c0_g1~~TRINITY_DN42043_c0_g1_i2.p1  ORF type:complete len:248 (+),score=29.09 TRINITY_DN42043_c0_g1_i2:108-851(+)
MLMARMAGATEPMEDADNQLSGHRVPGTCCTDEQTCSSKNSLLTSVELDSTECGSSRSASVCAESPADRSEEAQLLIASPPRQYCVFKPPSRLLPQRPADVSLAKCFFQLAQLEDHSSETFRLLLRTVMLLRSCRAPTEDICSVLAHASVYYVDNSRICGKMSSGEASNILILLIYVAHSYVLDVNCPLHIWHRYLFKQYCKLSTLDKAIIKLLELRNFGLRVDEADVQKRFQLLVHSVTSATQTGP